MKMMNDQKSKWTLVAWQVPVIYIFFRRLFNSNEDMHEKNTFVFKYQKAGHLFLMTLNLYSDF